MFHLTEVLLYNDKYIFKEHSLINTPFKSLQRLFTQNSTDEDENGISLSFLYIKIS